jgi:large subunit ribosomal protein L17
MRHRVAHRKLNKPTDQRLALLRGLVNALFLRGRVVTTEARAKELRRLAEKLITTAREDTVHNRRQVRRWIQRPPLKGELMRTKKYREAEHPERNILDKLFKDIAPRYKEREGGYTRLVKVAPRRGDSAPRAVVVLVE